MTPTPNPQPPLCKDCGQDHSAMESCPKPPLVISDCARLLAEKINTKVERWVKAFMPVAEVEDICEHYISHSVNQSTEKLTKLHEEETEERIKVFRKYEQELSEATKKNEKLTKENEELKDQVHTWHIRSEAYRQGSEAAELQIQTLTARIKELEAEVERLNK